MKAKFLLHLFIKKEAFLGSIQIVRHETGEEMKKSFWGKTLHTLTAMKNIQHSLQTTLSFYINKVLIVF